MVPYRNIFHAYLLAPSGHREALAVGSRPLTYPHAPLLAPTGTDPKFLLKPLDPELILVFELVSVPTMRASPLHTKFSLLELHAGPCGVPARSQVDLRAIGN